MRSGQQGEPHLQAGLSLLRLSLGARLLIVACVSVLLWSAVLWALR
jgi:hypothetical protein